MPEGHVTHRLATALTADFAGRPTISSSPQGRFAAEAARITGRTLHTAESYGKHLFVAFDGTDESVHVHLGMAGRLSITSGTDLPTTGAIRWRLAHETMAAQDPAVDNTAVQNRTVDNPAADRVTADLRGPAACELLLPDEIDALLARLGPDPLRADADPEIAWRRIHASRVPVAALLMDQRVTAGVGNIFRAEVLFRHRIDPMMAGRLLRRAEWTAIWADLVDLMRYGVEHGRIDSVRPEHEPEAMGRAPRVDRHGGEVYVYRRTGQRCHICGSVVRTAELAGRNLFWCPGCQRKTRRSASV